MGVYAEMRNMLTVLCLIVSAAADTEKAGIKEKIDVLRVKNRFAEPTSGGWADFMVSFRFRSDPNQHVCELQLCHKDMMTVRKKMGAHREYAEFRSALELLEVTGHVDRIAKIEALKAQVSELKQQLAETKQELTQELSDTKQEL